MCVTLGIRVKRCTVPESDGNTAREEMGEASPMDHGSLGTVATNTL